MSDPVQITITSNAQAALNSAAAAPGRILQAVAKTMDEQNELTVGVIQRDRLNFDKDGPTQPDGLRHVTGRLFKSASRTRAIISGLEVSSTIGSNVIYARAQEEGFDGNVTVRAHKRRDITQDRYKSTRGGNFKLTQMGIKQRIGSFERHMHLPARAPFRHGIESRAANYRDNLSAAILSAFQS